MLVFRPRDLGTTRRPIVAIELKVAFEAGNERAAVAPNDKPSE